MSRILNVRTTRNPYTTTETQIYIGRPSKWGNPFMIGKDGSREEVIEKYKNYLTKERPDLMKQLGELKGKDLVCWCAPLGCHGHVLLDLVRKLEEEKN